MMELGVWQDDELTFTGCVAIPDITGAREGVAACIFFILPVKQAERTLSLLKDNEWDLSFFVDCQ